MRCRIIWDCKQSMFVNHFKAFKKAKYYQKVLPGQNKDAALIPKRFKIRLYDPAVNEPSASLKRIRVPVNGAKINSNKTHKIKNGTERPTKSIGSYASARDLSGVDSFKIIQNSIVGKLEFIFIGYFNNSPWGVTR